MYTAFKFKLMSLTKLTGYSRSDIEVLRGLFCANEAIDLSDLVRIGYLNVAPEEYGPEVPIIIDYIRGYYARVINLQSDTQIEQAGLLLMALISLKQRFEARPELHERLEWQRVREALINNPKALESIAKMEVAGHEPNVYNFDDDGFDVGTCSPESPMSGSNCVYDAQTVVPLRENYPDEICNGSAVEMAKAMGIGLMSPAQYRDVLQSKGKFDMQTLSWLLTDEATREAGVALFGVRGEGGVYVSQHDACDHSVTGAWRGSLRVLWA
ncbi:hypothetical protein CO045_00570 [Candidatus Peregrinibacteria bacterium CG_4_9_14_0_2_um_filter_41_14]|nr:MAG: hypothetical protein CO045_00570 [Candidatus Peregrinibacteria bacterium CG_4_9_14_0_2_um_filter_41_14]